MSRDVNDLGADLFDYDSEIMRRADDDDPDHDEGCDCPACEYARAMGIAESMGDAAWCRRCTLPLEECTHGHDEPLSTYPHDHAGYAENE